MLLGAATLRVTLRRAGQKPEGVHYASAKKTWRAVKRRMIDWFGPILVEYWGGSEGGVFTTVGSHDWLEHPGTVGRALPGFEVFAVDDTGEPLPADEVGVLYSRTEGHDRPFEYWNAPDKTDARARRCFLLAASWFGFGFGLGLGLGLGFGFGFGFGLGFLLATSALPPAPPVALGPAALAAAAAAVGAPAGGTSSGPPWSCSL